MRRFTPLITERCRRCWRGLTFWRFVPLGQCALSRWCLQFGQGLLQQLHVCIPPVFTLAPAGAALHKLHLHGQLAELKVFAFFAQVHAAAYGAVLRAQCCRASHSQGIPARQWDIVKEESFILDSRFKWQTLKPSTGTMSLMWPYTVFVCLSLQVMTPTSIVSWLASKTPHYFS